MDVFPTSFDNNYGIQVEEIDYGSLEFDLSGIPNLEAWRNIVKNPSPSNSKTVPLEDNNLETPELSKILSKGLKLPISRSAKNSWRLLVTHIDEALKQYREGRSPDTYLTSYHKVKSDAKLFFQDQKQELLAVKCEDPRSGIDTNAYTVLQELFREINEIDDPIHAPAWQKDLQELKKLYQADKLEREAKEQAFFDKLKEKQQREDTKRKHIAELDEHFPSDDRGAFIPDEITAPVETQKSEQNENENEQKQEVVTPIEQKATEHAIAKGLGSEDNPHNWSLSRLQYIHDNIHRYARNESTTSLANIQHRLRHIDLQLRVTMDDASDNNVTRLHHSIFSAFQGFADRVEESKQSYDRAEWKNLYRKINRALYTKIVEADQPELNTLKAELAGSYNDPNDFNVDPQPKMLRNLWNTVKGWLSFSKLRESFNKQRTDWNERHKEPTLSDIMAKQETKKVDDATAREIEQIRQKIARNERRHILAQTDPKQNGPL